MCDIDKLKCKFTQLEWNINRNHIRKLGLVVYIKRKGRVCSLRIV